MLRNSVAAFHCALAIALTLRMGIAMEQAWWNALWEVGFYVDQVSPETAGRLFLCVAAMCLAVAEVASALVYATGSHAAGTALLVVSIGLMFFLPPPLRWLVTGVAFMVLVEAVVSRLPELPEID